MKRLITAFGIAALALAAGLPPVRATTHSTTTTATLFVSSLNCQYEGQSDCTNIVIAITQDPTGAAEFCVSIGDYHDPHPPVANGCVWLSAAQVSIDDTHVVIQETVEIPAVYSTDCYQVPPEEACTPRALTLSGSASFAATGSPDYYRHTTVERGGQCTITNRVRGSRVAVTGSVVIDGFAYDLSGTDPSLHHFEAWLTRESVRSSARCGRMQSPELVAADLAEVMADR